MVAPPGNRAARLAGFVTLALLAGCGGGADTVETGGGNLPPVANAGSGQTVFEGTQVSLSGAGSDPENNPLSFFWTQLSGPAVNIVSASTANASFVAPDVAPGAPETLTFELEVSDGVVSDTDTVSFVVEENVPPVADAGPDRTVGPNVQVTLDGSLSDDANSIGQLSFSWTQVAGPAVTLNGASTVSPSFVSPVPGGAALQLQFELAVSDGTFTATDTVTILVDDDPNVNAPPVADAGPDQTVAAAAQVTLDGSASSDPDSAQLAFSWTQTAGPAVALAGANTAAPSFTAPNLTGGPVQLVFQLTVSDGQLSDSDSVTINVGDDDPNVNIRPVANAGPDHNVFEGDAVTLTGSGSDADGDPITFAWVQIGGPAVTLSSTTTATTGFVAPDVAAGAPVEFVFELTVSDGQLSDSDTVTVRVEENEPPVADAGPDQIVAENEDVTLDGSGSSDPNSIGGLTFAWVQTGGTAVVLAGANTVQPTFTAPTVTADEDLTFQLTVSDGTFSDTDTVTVTVQHMQGSATISGRVSYEFVPPRANCSGLDFANVMVRPIRQATVQLRNASSGAVLATTVADDSGNYSFPGVAVDTDVRLRVRAELHRTGTPGWNVEIRDNTANTGSPLPSRPLYVMDGPSFNSGSGGTTTHDLTAQSGWDGSAYSGNRTAAPFAILDAIYSGMRLVLSVEPGATFETLDAYWSVNNTATNGDIGAGEIGTSFYTGDPDGGTRNPSLFLLGDAADDTDEFDDHLVVHEWGHYFEDSLSRSDSIGGPHSLGQRLDARLAFGEGFATALAAMALDEPQYCDTGIPGTASGFGINAESSEFGAQGWYNEVSVTTLLYDLWDDAVDQTDTGSIGFGPIYATMVGPQSSTPAFTSIFSFAAELRPMLDAAGQALLDSQLSRESIQPAVDIWGAGETNNANNADVLPVYTDMTADGSVLNICTNSDFDRPSRTGNKLAEHRYLRLAVPATDRYDVVVATTTPTPVLSPPAGNDQSDPDIYIYRDGSIVAWGNSPVADLESFETQSALQAGVTYAVDVEEWRFDDPNAATTFPERICFDVSFTPTP